MRPDLSRSSALFATLLALLPHRSAGLLGATAAPTGPRSFDPLSPSAAPLFPLPQALRLLDVIEGARRGSSSHRTGQATSGPAIGYPAGRDLLDQALAAGDFILSRFVEIHGLAIAASNPALSAEERALLDHAYQGELAALAALARTTAFKGIPLIDGSRDVHLVLPPSGGTTILVDLPDWNTTTLGLSGAIANPEDAGSALDLLDTAIAQVALDRERLSIARQELVEGVPDGGLRELERLLGRMRGLAQQASGRTLMSADRWLLDLRHRSDLVRIDAVAEAAAFEGVALFDGGQVWLQDVLGATLVFDLPDADVEGLGLSCAELSTLSNATAALKAIGAALCEVKAQREAVLEAQDALVNGVIRLP
ncbi:MAG: hypothetical protein HOP15_10130 [Planctomycetes bacterium]|nr:hypothetical protein [Planctomycetota bacterium]